MALTLTMVTDKENALCQYLTAEVNSPSMVEPADYADNSSLFTVTLMNNEKAYGTRYCESTREYLVYTDSEATAAAIEDIESTLWAFNYDFLAKHSEIIAEIPADVWAKLQEACESLNPLVRAVIGGDFGNFAAAAIQEDGRENFIASYDGEEHAVEYNGVTYFIYRTN